MLSSIFEKLTTQAWSAITLQTSILAVNMYAMIKGDANGYTITSSALILSLFSLQVVSTRFLILYPFNGFSHRPTPKIDTYILKSFMAFSIFFLIIGLAAIKSTCLQRFEPYFDYSLYVSIPVLIPILPIYWVFWGSKRIIEGVVADLKNNPLEFRQKCPKDDHSLTVTRRVLSQNIGEITKECKTCNYKYVEDSLINIAY
ncbi:hypothetical protein N9174_04875 [bacterium]|nr:hypothetical protein [bacterium]